MKSERTTMGFLGFPLNEDNKESQKNGTKTARPFDLDIVAASNDRNDLIRQLDQARRECVNQRDRVALDSLIKSLSEGKNPNLILTKNEPSK